MIPVTQDVIGRRGGVIGLPASARAVGAPDLVVEDHVLDVQIARVGNQPLGENPPLAAVLLGDRTEEDVDPATAVVGRFGSMALADTSGCEPAQC
ncbi:hypothetical protein [Kocuria atrinae]|uniref:hypothetical protein n=1 Tax=Kocuria atrinae TaxID=592377 RepID=UPI001CB9B43A|nr:hypothetical protein [Kocuria atrinae]